MRWWCVVVVVAACGTGAEPRTDPRSDPSIADAPVPERPPPAPITGAHGARIALIAITADASAAVTSDDHGGLRVWPTLDGSREPIVVHGAAPTRLAIARDDDGLVIAIQDEAGGAELVRFAPRGDVRGRATLAAEPAIEQLALVDDGVLVRRADQRLELVSHAGRPRAALVPDAGTRVTALLTPEGSARADRALAIVRDGARTYGRWISVGVDALAWGATTPRLRLEERSPIALAPDGATLIAQRTRGAGSTAVLVDVGTGKRGAEVCGRPRDRRDLDEEDFAVLDVDAVELFPRAIGFVDATTVACAIDEGLAWWGIDGAQRGTSTPMDPAEDGTLTAGNGRVVGAARHQLVLLAPDRVRYLGYGLRDLSHVRVVPAGLLLGKGDGEPLLVDRRFRELGRFPLPKRGDVEWADVVPLDARFVLAVSARGPAPGDPWGTTYHLAVYDAATGQVHQRLPELANQPAVEFEPASRLLVTSDAGAPGRGPSARLLLRLDPVTHRFTERFDLEVELGPASRVQLLDPARSGGVVAIATRQEANGTMIYEVHEDDLRGGAASATSVRPRRSYLVPIAANALRAIDRTGRVYGRDALDAGDLDAYVRGVKLGRLAGLGPAPIQPSPDGAHLAVLADQRVRLYTFDGELVWETALWGVTEVGWAPTGELFARFAGALANLDLTTGALAERQCGWRFGIAEAPLPTIADGPNVCDVAP